VLAVRSGEIIVQPAKSDGGPGSLRRSIALRLAATETLASLIHGHEFATLTPILFARRPAARGERELTVPQAYSALVGAHNRICRSPVTGSALRRSAGAPAPVQRRLPHAVRASQWPPPRSKRAAAQPTW